MKPRKRKRRPGGQWSAKVTNTSDALDLKEDIFTEDSPGTIASSLKKSAKSSKRRKGTAYQSAMSMLNFYINRAGKNLPAKRKRILNKAKGKLRDVFGKSKA